jgi:TPP-dependent pyruvate/acetoin dehydrogenase alpha subunit
VDPPPAGRATRGEAEYPLRRVLSDEGDADPAAVGLTDGELLRLHRWMVTGRELDERMVLLHRQGRIGFYVGAVGEEATIVGTAAAMETGDWLFPSYREHVAALMRGLPLATFVCNLLGNAGDLLRGRQMPCHESWRPGRFTSVSAPIATQLPHAVGAAWAARIRGDDMVALVWFGEGATSAGDFHAALNMAGVRKIPVVFACRNNGWAISTPRELQTASETIAQKAVAYGIHGERVDGNDLLAVFEATRRARARAAAGEGPTLLECVTYRLGPHTTSDDPRAYRSEAEVAPWRARDPILRLRRLLERRGLLTAAAADEQLEEVRAEIRDAVRVAEAQPAAPPVESMFDDVYAQRTWVQEEQRAGLPGDPAPPR